MQQLIHEENSYTYRTQTAVRRWGNSQGIRLSKEVMSQMGLKTNDTLELSINNGRIVIMKVSNSKYSNLEERLEAFYHKPIDEIFVENSQEVDVGDPVGDELW